MNIQHKLLRKAIRESIFRGTLWASVFAAALASGSLYAQDAALPDDEADESDLLIEEQTVVKNYVEVGIGSVSDPSYRWSRPFGARNSPLRAQPGCWQPGSCAGRTSSAARCGSCRRGGN